MSNEAASSHNISALSATSSSTSVARKQPLPHLEAIQTQKAQASVTFRPVSSTSVDNLDVVGGVYGGLSPHSPHPSHPSPHPSHPSTQQQQSEHTSQDQHKRSGPGAEVAAETIVEGEEVNLTYSEPTLMTATTANESFPFTPSTLVEGIFSPAVNLHSGSNCYPLSTIAGRDESWPQPHLSQQQQQSLQHRSAGSETRRSSQQQHASFSKIDPPNLTCLGNTSANSTAPPTGVALGLGSGSRKSQGSQGMDLTYSNSSDGSRFQQLPTLWQVLHRKTLPPVCLFNFYLYMRDHERSSEEVDFWLDVTAHELLWRLYVRATKRRLTQERMEREERNAGEAGEAGEAEERKRVREAAAALALAEAEMLESEQRKLQQVEQGHQKKPSVSLDMYEPHWSAVNRYLEISELDSDSHSTTELNNGLNEIPHQQHQSDQVTEGSHIKGGSEPILLQYASPTSPLSPTPTIRRGVPHLPGAVPDNWGHMNDPQNIHDAGAGPSGTSALSVRGSVIKKGTTNSRGADAGVANLSGTLGVATNTRRSTNIKRAITLGTSGVTKEDLQESAERIYYKYLTPQAETPVRIPNSVRRRVAQLMDSKIMIGPAAAVASGATSKRKNTMDTANLANAPFSPPMISPTSPIPNSSDKLKVAPRSDPHHPHRNSNNSSNNNNNSLQQPDQDLGLVFAEAREIVFEGMESYYFPRFIEARVYGNMVHSHRVARAVLGLGILFFGFVIMFCLIFLNRPRSLRRWAVIPIFVGILICTTFQFNICPLMAAFGVSEAKWMQFGKIKEPHIMMLHRKRAVKVVVVALLYTICVGAIFGIVPGHRL